MMHRSMIFLLILVPALLLFTSCAETRRLMNGPILPSAEVTGSRLSSMKFDGTTLTIDVTVRNPYSVPLMLVGADYELRVDGSRVLDGIATEEVMVPAAGEAVYSVALYVSYTELMHAYSRMNRGASYDWTAWIRVESDCPNGIGRVRTPVKGEGELPIPASPIVTLSDLRWEDADAERLSAVVRMEIGNPNAFPVEVTGVDYELRLSGLPAGGASADTSTVVPAAEMGKLSVGVEVLRRQVGTNTLTRAAKPGSGYGLAGLLYLKTPWGEFNAPFTAHGVVK